MVSLCLERARGLSDRGGGETVYGVSEEKVVAEQELFLDSEQGDGGLDAGLTSDATWARR